MGGPVQQDASVLKCCVPAAVVAESWDAGQAHGSSGVPLSWFVASGVVPRQVSQPSSTRRLCLKVTVGICCPASLMLCQLLSCSASNPEIGVCFYLFHYIKYSNLKKKKPPRKQPTPTSGKPPVPKGISREGYFPFVPAGQGCCPFIPWCSAFHFEV